MIKIECASWHVGDTLYVSYQGSASYNTVTVIVGRDMPGETEHVTVYNRHAMLKILTDCEEATDDDVRYIMDSLGKLMGWDK